MVLLMDDVRVLEVVAAVIEGSGEHGGRILIGQRKPGGRHALKWEFPGGKVEPGEEPRAALARELREELSIDAQIGNEIERYDFNYAGQSSAPNSGKPMTTRLIFYRVTEFTGEPENLDFAQIAWVRKEDLPAFDFLEGDVDFVRRLARVA